MKYKAPSEERIAILKRIEELEAEGGDSYYVDVEPDPPGLHPLTPEEVDYLQTKFSSRFKAFWARRIQSIMHRIVRKDLKFKVVGKENLAGIRGGVIFTSNHFSKFENLAVKEVSDLVPGKHKFYKVIKGSNYFLTGIIGFLMKNCDTLPLSTNIKTTRLFGAALKTILERGDHVLIYPEQAMWWNYRKSRPFKPGAFFYASKFNVPIVPLFVTMEGQNTLDGYGFPKQSYTIHVMPPIYPDPQKPLRENENEMLEKNQLLCAQKYCEVYEKAVDKPEEDCYNEHTTA